MVREHREGTCSLTKYCPTEKVTLQMRLDILTGSKGERAFKADKKNYQLSHMKLPFLRSKPVKYEQFHVVQPNTKTQRFERAQVICENGQKIESNFQQLSKGQTKKFRFYFISN